MDFGHLEPSHKTSVKNDKIKTWFCNHGWLLAIIHDAHHVEAILLWINTKIMGLSDELNSPLSATVIVVLIQRC